MNELQPEKLSADGVAGVFGAVITAVLAGVIAYQGNEISKQANRIANEQANQTHRFNETCQRLEKLGTPPAITLQWEHIPDKVLQMAVFRNEGGPCFTTRAELVDRARITVYPRETGLFEFELAVEPDYEGGEISFPRY